MELSLDQPMTGLQRAVWWTEYVLRTRNTKHLRGSVTNIPLYKYYLIDVIGLTIAVIIIISYLFIKLLLFLSYKLYEFEVNVNKHKM